MAEPPKAGLSFPETTSGWMEFPKSSSLNIEARAYENPLFSLSEYNVDVIWPHGRLKNISDKSDSSHGSGECRERSVRAPRSLSSSVLRATSVGSERCALLDSGPEFMGRGGAPLGPPWPSWVSSIVPLFLGFPLRPPPGLPRMSHCLPPSQGVSPPPALPLQSPLSRRTGEELR